MSVSTAPNPIVMGVLPLNFADPVHDEKVKDLADATFDIVGIADEFKPMRPATLVAHLSDGTNLEIPLKVRLGNPAEVDYYNAGGIRRHVLEQILAEKGGCGKGMQAFNEVDRIVASLHLLPFP